MILNLYHLSMKLITREVDYAVRALAAVARAGGGLSAAGLAGPAGVPRPVLRKIMQALSRGGITRSSRGRGGGFVLARPPRRISLGDIIAAVRGPLKFNDCVFGGALCHNHRTCLLRGRVAAIERKVLDEVRRVTLADLS